MTIMPTDVEPDYDLVPVSSNDAEVSLLGAAMSGYRDLDELFDLLESGDFYHPMNGHIWDAIAQVHRSGVQPDPVSVRVRMQQMQVQGFDPIALLHMTQVVPLVGQAGFYAHQVATSAGMRRLVDAGSRIQQLARSQQDLEQVRERSRQIVDDAADGKQISRARTIANIMPGVIDRAQNGAEHVLGTGWPDIDRLIGGLAPGRLVVVGARPGIGKSVMGTNLALHFARHHGHAVLLSSMEMPEEEVGQRLLAASASVNLSLLQQGLDDERAWGRISTSLAELSALPITVDDTPSQTVTTIRRAARDIQRQRDDLSLIVVDYLQQIRPSDGRLSNRVEQLGEISRNLKLLARETGACVVAMAQVNREGAKNADGRPRMTDLRESGSIEADADQVLLMHQPDNEIPEIEVIVDKNRHGPKGQARLQIQGHYARLVSVEWTPSGTVA